MKKNVTLSKKLLSYCSVATVFLASSKNADGQVLYHNFIPDDSLSGFTQFDLNNDGVYDLAFNAAHASNVLVYNSQNYDKVSCTASIRASTYNSLAGGVSGLAQLNSGDVIDGNLNWVPSATFLLGYFYKNDFTDIYSASGNWANVTDKFFGIKVNANSDTYYGWMRMSVDGYGCGVTLKDFAYNSTPDEFILAGDTGLAAVVDMTAKPLSADFFIENQTLFISLNKTNTVTTCFTIIDLLGRKRNVVNCNRSSSEISIAHLEAGEYLLLIQSGDQQNVLRFLKN